MDGTLIQSDLLLESTALLLRDKPWMALALPFWTLQGRAVVKRRIADRVRLKPETLPYNTEVLQWLREEKAKGRPLILATAAEAHLAVAVADHVGLFDHVLGSDGVHNLKGTKKLDALRDRYGADFDYAGDSSADLPIWRICREAILVNPSAQTLLAAKSVARIARVFETSHDKGRLIVQELRVQRWIRNILVFVPLLGSTPIGRPDLWFRAFLGFIALCLLASGLYVVNDVVDLESDRQDLHKRTRPFADGRLSLKYAALMAPLLIVVAFAVTALLTPAAISVLAMYLLASLFYSFGRRRSLLAGVCISAALYMLRMMMGAASGNLPMSPDLPVILSVSIALFERMAISKRTNKARSRF